MKQLGLFNTLVTHANMKGFGLTPLFRNRLGYMTTQLNTKQKQGPQMQSEFFKL